MANMILMYRDELYEEHYLAEFEVPKTIAGIPFDGPALWAWQSQVEEQHPINEECNGYVWEDRRMWSTWQNIMMNDPTFEIPWDLY